MRADAKDVDVDARRAEIQERRARHRAAHAALLPEQRLLAGVVYGPVIRGRLIDLAEGDLLEVCARRRYDRIVEGVGVEPRARTRVTVLFAGATHPLDTRGFRINVAHDACSYRRPVA